MEQIGIPNIKNNIFTGKSNLSNFLIKFTPNNHSSVKNLEMNDNDYLVEVPLDGKMDEQRASHICEIIKNFKKKNETNSKLVIETVDGVNYPITYFDDGLIIVDYPVFLKNL